MTVVLGRIVEKVEVQRNRGWITPTPRVRYEFPPEEGVIQGGETVPNTRETARDATYRREDAEPLQLQNAHT
jgi:hypothetical protein